MPATVFSSFDYLSQICNKCLSLSQIRCFVGVSVLFSSRLAAQAMGAAACGGASARESRGRGALRRRSDRRQLLELLGVAPPQRSPLSQRSRGLRSLRVGACLSGAHLEFM